MLVRNKLVKWWTHNDSETATFADDTKLYKEIRSSDDELALQTDLSNVGSWSTESGLEFNKTKSHHQSITRKTKALNTAYDMNGAKTNHERDLGVWVSTFTYMIFVSNLGELFPAFRRLHLWDVDLSHLSGHVPKNFKTVIAISLLQKQKFHLFTETFVPSTIFHSFSR